MFVELYAKFRGQVENKIYESLISGGNVYVKVYFHDL